MKIEKWECFFVFDTGERESMWEIKREKGKKLSSYETNMLDNFDYSRRTEVNFPFVMVITYADGSQEEIK